MINQMLRMKMLGIIMLIFLFACGQKAPELRVKSYVDDPDNKITQTITIGEVAVVAKYLPAPYRSLMGNQPDSLKEEDVFYYFNVKFNKITGDKPAKEKVLYLNFDMQNDFVLLVNDKDSIAPAICQKIENGIAGSYEYMVVFEKRNGEELSKDMTLFYHDKIFSIGTVAFVFKEKDIEKIPKLKVKELK